MASAGSNVSNFDAESFIIEIRNRPILWDPTTTDYNNRNAKRKAWEEICNLFIQDFVKKTTREKNEAAVTLQKKWKGLRDSYIRDKNKQIKINSGAYAPKEYLYSHVLSFLIPVIRTRQSNTPSPSYDENTTDTNDDSTVTKKARTSNSDAEDDLIQILIQRMEDRCQNNDKIVGSDPEQHFLLSLADDLKAVHPHYKMDAKMEMMEVLKKYKQMSTYSKHHSGYFLTSEPSRSVSLTPTLSSPSVIDDSTQGSIYDSLSAIASLKKENANSPQR